MHGISAPSAENWLEGVEVSDRARVEESLDRSVQSREPFECEYRVIREGQTRWIQSRAGASPDGSGRVVRLAGWSVDITERKLAESELRTSNNALRALWANLQSVREEERARIAREIHDDLGQCLTVLKINLARLDGSLVKEGREAPATLKSAIRQVDSALKAVRRIIAELHPVILDELGLGPALEWAVEEFSKHSGVPCLLEFDLGGVRLSKEQSAAFFRIRPGIAREHRASRLRYPRFGRGSLQRGTGRVEGDGQWRGPGSEQASEDGLLRHRRHARARRADGRFACLGQPPRRGHHGPAHSANLSLCKVGQWPSERNSRGTPDRRALDETRRRNAEESPHWPEAIAAPPRRRALAEPRGN